MNPEIVWRMVLAGVSTLALFTGVAAAQPKPIAACGTTISAPGSYLVTQNLTSANTTVPCINVTASGVTIDLGGFVLTGIGGSSGIAASAGPLNISNGIIRSFSIGINAPVKDVTVSSVTLLGHHGGGAVLGDNAEVTDSEFLNNSGNGLSLVSNALVADCIMAGNGGSGLFAGGSGAVVTASVASEDGGAVNNPGFTTAGHATLSGNAANANTFAGFMDRVGGVSFEGDTATATTPRSGIAGGGFDTGEQSKPGAILGGNTFIGSSALDNDTAGFADAGGSTYVANAADFNPGAVGFFSPGQGFTYVTNTADSNLFGFNMFCPSNLVGNTAENNTTTNFAPAGGSGCNVQINLGF